MPEHYADSDGVEAPGREGTDTGAETVESYETDDGVVLYDAERPLAWVESETAVRLANAR